jgi:protein-tyrosine-phosphatase
MFAIYFVCTGNRCRSPVAAAAMRRAVEGLDVAVGSAGVMDLGGLPPPAETAEAAARLGLDVRGHLSVPLSGVDVTDADLVLGFERRHVAAAVVEAGASPARTFGVVELATLLRDRLPADQGTSDPLQRARRRVAAAHRRRQETARFVPGEEISDPMGLALPAHIEVATEVEELCKVIAAELFG